MGKATIYFEQGEKEPIRGEIDKLKSLVEVIQYPGTKVNLFGHASQEGTDRFNMSLSEDRARSVEAYLIVMGAERSQIKVRAFGERKPAVKEQGSGAKLESLRAKNRRVEVDFTVGEKPDEYKKLVDRTRERFRKGVEALKSRLKKAEAGRARTLAHPQKVPSVLRYWQAEVDQTRDELKDWESMLRDLEDAERKLKDPRAVWLHITKPSSYYDKMIQYEREHIKNTKARLDEAKKELDKASDEQNRKFWEEMVRDYTDVLKDAETELGWRIKDKQRAATQER